MEYYEEMLDVIQLHGKEDDTYIRNLRKHTDKPIIKAFKITSGGFIIPHNLIFVLSSIAFIPPVVKSMKKLLRSALPYL